MYVVTLLVYLYIRALQRFVFCGFGFGFWFFAPAAVSVIEGN